ncbi:MAG: sigma-70 family RNA polymerase sigma factor [Planctomycetota bacterium]
MPDFREPSASELLAEGQWLRRFLSDVLPAHAVDDALQETWTRAVRGVPGAPAALRPWLRTVSRRVAGAFRREEGRRRVRERQMARPEEQPATIAVLERLDLHQRITAIVRELPEPYRSTVLLRYYEGVTVKELARRFATTPDNVHARLARARVMIRERLPEDVRGRLPLVLAPSAAGAGWLAVAAVLCVAGLGTVWALLEPATMPTPAAGAAAAPALAAAPGRPPAARAPRALASGLAVPVPRTPLSASVGPAASAAPTAPTAPAPRGVRVRVRPAPAGGTLRLQQESAASAVAVLDARGAAEFVDARVGDARLRLSLPSGTTFDQRWRIRALGEEHVWRLGTATFEVQVYEDNGGAAAGAFVWLSGGGLDVRARTGADGRVLLSHLTAADYRVYASIERDGAKVMEEVRQVEVGEPAGRAVFGSPDGLPRWTGRLLAATGEPVEGAAADDRGKLVLIHADTGVLVPVFTDRGGAFAVRLAAGRYRVMVSPHSCVEAHLRVADMVVNTREVERDLVVPGARVMVRASVLSEAAAASPLSLTSRADRPTQHRTMRRHDGVFVFDGVAPGEWDLTGEHLEPRSVTVTTETPLIAIDVVLR